VVKPWDSFRPDCRQKYLVIEDGQKILAVEGITTDKGWAAKRGAFSMAFQYPASVAKHFSDFSKAIAREVPAVIYEPEDIHTSLILTAFQDSFLYDPASVEQMEILNRLTKAAYRAIGKIRNWKFPFLFDDYLYTTQMVMAVGAFPREFVDLLAILEEAALSESLSVTTAWDAHVTMSRFTEPRPSHELGNLLGLLERAKGPGRCEPSSIVVGYSEWAQSLSESADSRREPNGHFTPYTTFPLGSI
jgi:hypothetical protein